MTEDKPHTRTYSGTESLPTLTDNYQAVPIGRNEKGDLVPEVRSFVATVRNRSSSDMWIKEGSNSDGILIGPEESYVVTRLDGLSQINLKGEGVGGQYEIRSVEAHNSFNIRDRIEAFVQSISAILRSNRNYTTIEASNATLDTQITGQSVQLDTNIAAANAVLDTNITASDTVLNTAIDGQNITLATDITAQSIDEIGIDIRKQTGGAVNERVVSNPAQGSFNSQTTQNFQTSFTAPENGSNFEVWDVDLTTNQLVNVPQGFVEWDINIEHDNSMEVTLRCVISVGNTFITDMGDLFVQGDYSPSFDFQTDGLDNYSPLGTNFLVDKNEALSAVFTLKVENKGSGELSGFIDADLTNGVAGSELIVE